MTKLLRIVGGFILIVVGLILALPGVPGPGLVIAAIGLAMLSKHFVWAKRTVDWGVAKLEGTPYVGDWMRKRKEKNAASSAAEGG